MSYKVLFSQIDSARRSAIDHTLYMTGNKNEEVILIQNKGYRLDGTRDPHSWNIIEEKDVIKWAKQILK